MTVYAATLECDHCGGDAVVSPRIDGSFQEDDGDGRCAECGFPGHISVDEECEGEFIASWACSQDEDSCCHQPECEACDRPTVTVQAKSFTFELGAVERAAVAARDAEWRAAVASFLGSNKWKTWECEHGATLGSECDPEGRPVGEACGADALRKLMGGDK